MATSFISVNLVSAFQAWLSEPKVQVALVVALCVISTYAVTAPNTNAPPGPRFVIPFVGETLEFITTSPLRFLWQRYKKYGSVFRCHLLGEWMYIISDPDVLRLIVKGEGVGYLVPGAAFVKLIENFDQMKDRKMHLQWRKYMTVALGPTAISKWLPDLQAVVDAQLNTWTAKKEFVLMDEYTELALDFAVDVISGMKLPEGVDKQWFKDKVVEFIGGLYGLPLDLPGTALHKALRAKEQIQDAFREAMEKEVALLKAKDAASAEQSPEAASMSLFEAQMMTGAAGGEMTVELALDRMMGNVVAATDTTRYMLWIATSLASRSPRVLARLREEQAQVIAEHGPAMTYQALQSMAYLDSTIRESMRVMPAAIGTFRRTTKPLQVGKYVVPKGATLMLTTNLPHALDPVLWDGDTSSDLPRHMDWKNHFEETFQPEHWLSGSSSKPRAFATFGAGEHLCLGMGLAFAEAKLVIASILRRFKHEFVDPDWLEKTKYFPGPRPVKGSDRVRVEPLSPV